MAEGSIEQVTIGVHPSGGADEVGIVVSAQLNDGWFAVLADRSTSEPRRKGARPWCAATTTSTPTTLWSKASFP